MIKKQFKKLILSTALVLSLAVALSIPAEALVIWHTEQADSGRQYTEGLGFDALGNPGIAQMAYYTTPPKAIYRYKSASGWTSEVLGDADGGVSLAYSASGQPSILYLNKAVSPNTLTYAKRLSENNWEQETVVTRSYIGHAFSLAFNNNNQPCFAYVADYTLYYVAYNGTSWQTQVVRKADDIGSPTLAFNGSTPAIAFSDDDGGLQYAYRTGSTWVIQTVDPLLSTTYRGRQDNITLRFGNGKPLISYNDLVASSLKFAYYLDGNWTTKTVEASTSSKNYTGEDATMQVSQRDSGYVVYLIHSNFVVNGSTTIKLKTLAVNNDNDLTNTAFTSNNIYRAYFGNAAPFLTSGLKDGNPSMAFLAFWNQKTFYISMEPDLMVASSVSFGAVENESTTSREITITNNGSVDLLISDITAPSSPFRITGNDFGTLASGESRDVTVHFEPTSSGVTYSDTLSIESNDPDHPVFNISLTGRSIGDTATLANLDFSNGANIALLPEDADANLTVPFATESLKITPTSSDPYGQIKIDGTVVQNGAMSATYPLEIGANTIEIVVTSEDTLTEKTYPLTITRSDSPDARLSALTIDTGTLSPAFSPEITSYRMTLPDGVSSFSLTPTATPMGASEESTIRINGTLASNGIASSPMTAAVGRNIYTINVLAPDGVSQMDYSIAVDHLPALSGISLNHGVLDSVFDPYDLSYDAIVANSATTISVTPTADAAYQLKINDMIIESDSASSPISLAVGDNTINIEVHSEDSETSRTYTLNIERLSGLSSLSVGDTPVLHSASEYQLSAYITQTEAPITFSAPEGMTVEITDLSNDSVLNTSEDGNTESISFQEGSNGPYTIELTSPECDETTVYTLTVLRYPLLTSLEIDGESITLWHDENFYMHAVTNSSENAVIKVTANPGTNIAPDGNYAYTPVDGQPNTWTVGGLQISANPLNLRLTSEDGEAQMTYDLIIHRPPGLSGLSVTGSALSPIFNVDTFDYTVTVEREVTAIALSAQTLEDGTLLSIAGTETYSDTLTKPIPLNYGSNIIPVVVRTNDFYGVSALYNVNVIREEPDAAVILPDSAHFDKYASAEGYLDISVTVTSSENPLLAIKNSGNILVAETDYTVSENTVTLKKEYLSLLPVGQANLTFDFSYGADSTLAVTLSDSSPAADDDEEEEEEEDPSTPPTDTPDTPDTPDTTGTSGGSDKPDDITTDTSNASVNIGAASSGIAGGADMVVDMLPMPGVSSYMVNLPASALNTSGSGSLTLNTTLGSVTIPGNMLLSVGPTGEAGINISEGDKANLPDDVKAAIGDRPLIQLTLSIDGKQTNWNDPEAPVTVSIPYTPTPEELAHPEGIVIWYIDGSGSATCVANGSYNSETNTVTFSTTHFSNFAVVYNPVNFNDVDEDAWYNKAVSYLAARSITNGTGGGKFNPAAKLMRGEFIVILMRAYGISPDQSLSDNFLDAGNTYYTNYLAVAKRLGLTNGVGNNRYEPEREITRQEMFTLLYNILKSINQLPQRDGSKIISDFTDVAQIESWAAEALTLLVKTGIVEGSSGKLQPTGTATRAEMAQVLFKLLSTTK